jgi:hypothetical protein
MDGLKAINTHRYARALRVPGSLNVHEFRDGAGDVCLTSKVALCQEGPLVFTRRSLSSRLRPAVELTSSSEDESAIFQTTSFSGTNGRDDLVMGSLVELEAFAGALVLSTLSQK